MYKDSECQTLKMKKNVIKNYSGFVRLQKFKTPGFSRAVLPFFPGLFQGFSRAFPGFLEVQNEKQHSQRYCNHYKATMCSKCSDSILSSGF